MASLPDLPATAERVLAVFASELEALGISLPETRYVAPGQNIPWDGEQLVVNLTEIVQGQPGAPYGGTFGPGQTIFSATFAVTIIREIPALTGEGPAAAMLPGARTLDTAGQLLIGDAAGLALAATAAHSKYELTGPGEGFAVGPCNPLGPEGGLAGNRQQITISLT